MVFFQSLRRHLANKLALLVTLAVILTVLALGIYFEMFLHQSLLHDTRIRIQHAYQRLDFNLNRIAAELRAGVASASQEQPLLASVELINHYQDKAHYNTVLIDEEKKTLAQELLERVKFSLNSDMALYDQSQELIAFVTRLPAGYQLGYVSYAQGESLVWTRLESEAEFRQGVLPASGHITEAHVVSDQAEAAAHEAHVAYLRAGDQLQMQAHQHVRDASGRHLGHLELSFTLDDAYFKRLSNDMDIALMRSFDSPFADQARLLGQRADIDALAVLESPNQYLGVMKKPTRTGVVYFTMALDKGHENALINTQRWRMGLFLLAIAASFLVCMRLVLMRHLIAPLNRLMQQIRQMRHGNYTECVLLATGDELEEIGQSVNTLGQTVSHREAALEQARMEADYLSKHDVVTGLPNQRFMAERMTHAVQLAHRNHTQLALLFLDLDQFKLVNDTLGHPIGDQLLAKIAERFGAAMRCTDTLARVGGDEFNILIENVPSKLDLEAVLDKYMGLFATPFACGEHQISITASIGVALYPADGHDGVSLLKHADLAVYAAKENGRNMYCFYTEDMSRLAGERVELIRDLKLAVDAGDQFELYYQPKVSAQTGQVVSAEALIRWHKPGVGLVAPFKFIPLAEETRQIVAIGDWVIEQTCRDLVHFARLDIALEHVSLNVSNVQLHGHDLMGVLKRALARHQVQAQQIELEITESYVAEDAALAIETLCAFRAMGCALAIDDFGTGYSSLSYLKKLPFSRLKIDKSFVDGIPGDPDSEAIARAIIGLAKTFGLAVTAEGVERAEQLAFLKREQCDEIQGYYYAKPMPVPDFVAFCRTHQAGLQSL